MAIEKFSCGEGGFGKAMAVGMAVSQSRHAIQMTWMALPPDRQTIDHMERELRRLVDRALRDLREDAQAFGLEG